MDARYTGFDVGTFGIRSVRVRRLATILAVACFAGFATPGPATAVLVSPDGAYYKPSLPASTTDAVLRTCPKDVCATDDVTDLYEDALQSAIASLEPFTIEVGKKEIDVENLNVSFSCIDLRQNDVDDCEDQAWEDYQAAVNGTHTKPGPWSDIPGAWDDYQDALANCQKPLKQDYRGRSDVQISGDLVSGNSEGSLSVTAKVEVDLCRAEVCLTDVEYTYDMGGWVGFLSDIGSVFGLSADATLVDGNGDEYPLSEGGSNSVCIPLSEVF